MKLAVARAGAVAGLALGHAKLSFRREGPRAPLNAGIYEAMTELVNTDPFGEGWLIKVNTTTLPKLLTHDEYRALVGE